MLFKDAQVTFEPVEIPETVGKVIENISYGPEKHQLFDLYLPNNDQVRGVILDLQGGGLVRGKKSTFKLGPTLKLTKDGYAVASMNYSFVSSGDYTFPKQVAEIRAALVEIKKKAIELNVPANQIELIGESSGAQLALLTAGSVTAGVKVGHIRVIDELEDLPTIGHVIANYGPYEFDQFARQFHESGITPKYSESGSAISFEGLALAGHDVQENPIGVSQANPANYFTSKMPPVLSYVGSDDQVVPYQQTLDMIERYQYLTGKEALCYEMEGGHHGIFDYDTEDTYQEKLAFLTAK